MTQKEMLTKILRRHESLCESCIKNNLECDEIACGFGRQIIDTADYLLANGVVVLPCKEGTTVYRVENNTEACHTCKDYCYGYGDAFCLNGEDEVRDYPEIAKKPICKKQFMEVKDYKPKLDWIFENRDDFGKTVFLTREEAKTALKKMEGET